MKWTKDMIMRKEVIETEGFRVIFLFSWQWQLRWIDTGGDTRYIPFIVIFFVVVIFYYYFYVVLLDEGAVNYRRGDRCGSAGALFPIFRFLLFFLLCYCTVGWSSEVWDGGDIHVFSWHMVLHKNVMHSGTWWGQKGKSIFLAKGRKLSSMTSGGTKRWDHHHHQDH